MDIQYQKLRFYYLFNFCLSNNHLIFCLWKSPPQKHACCSSSRDKTFLHGMPGRWLLKNSPLAFDCWPHFSCHISNIFLCILCNLPNKCSSRVSCSFKLDPYLSTFIQACPINKDVPIEYIDKGYWKNTFTRNTWGLKEITSLLLPLRWDRRRHLECPQTLTFTRKRNLSVQFRHMKPGRNMDKNH